MCVWIGGEMKKVRLCLSLLSSQQPAHCERESAERWRQEPDREAACGRDLNHIHTPVNHIRSIPRNLSSGLSGSAPRGFPLRLSKGDSPRFPLFPYYSSLVNTCFLGRYRPWGVNLSIFLPFFLAFGDQNLLSSWGLHYCVMILLYIWLRFTKSDLATFHQW